MARREKETTVSDITAKLSSARGVYLADFQGLNVQDINKLRNQLRQASVELKIVKNTLTRISVDQVGLKELVPYLTGPTAMVFCPADPIIAAKILFDYQKQNSKLSLKACVIDERVYDKTYIDKIAKLPSVDQIRAQTVGMIGAPLVNFVSVVNNLLTSLVMVLNEIIKKHDS